MAQVSYDAATCVYPNNPVPAVNELSLDVADGEFMVLVGPSGSGKSTALRMLAGLEPIKSGEVRIGGEDVSDRAPKDRDIAMVFQNYALYPHMSVAENMSFALKLRGVSKKEQRVKVREAAAMLDLEPYLDRRPGALSGGQRQRVAMGRAVVREPGVFLRDEPLSNLDAKLRVETRANIAALQARLGTTTIYVTHDQVEAMTMGHRVAVLKDGLLQQVDTPRVLYERPANTFVAGFIGSPAMNLVRVPLGANGSVALGDARLSLPEALAANGGELVVGLRPESLHLGATGVPAQVEVVEEIGADAYVFCVADVHGERTKLVARTETRRAPGRGDSITLEPSPEEAHYFDAVSG